MKNCYESFVYELNNPTDILWAKFKTLQPEVDRISLDHGLLTNSVKFNDETFQSNVMMHIPDETSLTKAAIDVCVFYAKNNMSHQLISRTGANNKKVESLALIKTYRDKYKKIL